MKGLFNKFVLSTKSEIGKRFGVDLLTRKVFDTKVLLPGDEVCQFSFQRFEMRGFRPRTRLQASNKSSNIEQGFEPQILLKISRGPHSEEITDKQS